MYYPNVHLKQLTQEWEVPRGLGFLNSEIQRIGRLQQFLQSLELWPRVLEFSSVNGNGSQVSHHSKANIPSIILFLFHVHYIKPKRLSLVDSIENPRGFRRGRPLTSETTDLLGLSRSEKKADARSDINMPDPSLSSQLSDRPSDSLDLHLKKRVWKNANLDIIMSRICNKARAWQTYFRPPLQSGYRRVEWICVCRPSFASMNP